MIFRIRAKNRGREQEFQLSVEFMFYGVGMLGCETCKENRVGDTGLYFLCDLIN